MKLALVSNSVDQLMELQDDFVKQIDIIYSKGGLHGEFKGIPICQLCKEEDTQYLVVERWLLPLVSKQVGACQWIGNYKGSVAPYPKNSWKILDSLYDWEKSRPDLRLQIAASYIPENAKSVVDLGAGTESLSFMLSPFCDYTPVDFKVRSEQTVVCDFDEKQYPAGIWDTAVAVGVLQYVDDIDWLVSKMADTAETCIVSYPSLDVNPDIRRRWAYGYTSHLTAGDLIKLFRLNGFYLDQEVTLPNDAVFVFRREI